jgi:opine dehydrogenase
MEDSMVFAVIGAGNTGQAMAGYLKFKGFTVKLYDRSEWRFKYLKKSPMKLSDEIESSQKIDLMTTDLEKAVEGANFVIVSTTTTAHAEIAKRLSEILTNDQIVLLHPGRTGGTLIFKKVFKENRPDLKITIGEFESSIFTTRTSISGTTVHYYGIKAGVHFAAIPAGNTRKIFQILKGIFPQIETAQNVLYTSLSNYGSILHPAPTLFNIGRIENGLSYAHYVEGITPSIANFLEKLDSERVTLGKYFKLRLKPLTVWLSDTYGSNGDNLYELLQNTKAYHKILGPNTLQHRYIVEDTLNGLVPFVHLARKCGIGLPITESLTNLIGHLLGIDVISLGRDLNDMGIANMDVQQIIDYVSNGDL